MDAQLDIFGGETLFVGKRNRPAPVAEKPIQFALFDLDTPQFEGERPIVDAFTFDLAV